MIIYCNENNSNNTSDYEDILQKFDLLSKVNFVLAEFDIEFKDLTNIQYASRCANDNHLNMRGRIGDACYYINININKNNDTVFGSINCCKVILLNIFEEDYIYKIHEFPIARLKDIVMMYFQGDEYQILKNERHMQMSVDDLTDRSKDFVSKNLSVIEKFDNILMFHGNTVETELPSIDHLIGQICNINDVNSILTLRQTHEEGFVDIYWLFLNNREICVVKQDDLLLFIDNIQIINIIDFKDSYNLSRTDKYFMIDDDKLVPILTTSIDSTYYYQSKFPKPSNISRKIFRSIIGHILAQSSEDK